MNKATYLILALALGTTAIGTASHYRATASLTTETPISVNDTIDSDDETEFGEEDDEFGGFTEEEEEEFGEYHEEDLIDSDQATTEQANYNEKTNDDIDLTEGMIIDLEEQMGQWNNKQYLSADSTTVQGTAEIDENEYVRRLKRIPAIMEMPYNDVVRKYIEQYTNRLRRSVSMMLGAQNFYVPIFEEALEAEDCPLELKYLPIIESALNPTATSRVGAAGLWQFMVTTGKQYGLEVNSLVDERRDPIKSSQAAAAYLKRLYTQLGDWTLVIAAYNCGPNNVTKAIQRAGGSRDYWEIYPYLPRETRGYVPAFIAANYVMQYYCEHGITPMQATLPAESDTVIINKDLHLQQVADLCNVELDQLKALNPQYRQDILPGYWKPCTLRLPAEAVSKFISVSDTIYSYRASELLPRRSTAAVNDSYSPVIRSGNAGVNRSSRSSYSKSRKHSSSSRSVTVRKGDTLGAIARRNGTTVAKLRQLNGISGSNIRAGKKLRVK